MKKLAIKKTNRIGILLLAIVVMALLVGGAVFALTHFQANKPRPASDPSTSNSANDSGGSITNSQYDAPSDGKSADDNNNSSSSPVGQSVAVLITDANQYGSVVEVRAYANVLENGTCTYTFTRGSSIITKQTNATAGASTTSCATLDTPVSEFSSGTWSVKVVYSSQSNKYSGSSSSQSITVQ